MGKQIKDVYIIHHSHTDIGYTDLQEQVIYNQVQNIRNVISILRLTFAWNGSWRVLRKRKREIFLNW